jgi:integrase
MSSKRQPSYCLHRASGQAVVRIGGKDFYLGKYHSAESRAEYDRLIAEWYANGRSLPPRAGDNHDAGLTVNELAWAFWQHAEQHYRRPDGTPTDEIHCLRAALRPLKALYGHTPAKDFGPLALKAVRQRMIETVDPRTGRPWCRRSINLHTYRIRSVFRWGVENELVPPPVLHGLQAVRGLQQGRSEARETGPVKPVPPAWVEAVKPFVRPPVRAMIELQMLTGMRPGEVVLMRAIDLNTSGKVWLYTPSSDQGEHGAHKTAWHGLGRVIAIGPQAQEVLKPFLTPDLAAYLFAPPQPKVGRARAKRRPGSRYTVDSYRVAIARACKRAGVPHWHPHQLRHTKATEIRREFGLDASRAVLGHRSPAVTEVYAELDVSKEAAVAEKIG